ncbi:MAG: hypothetical protein ACOC80_12210 [Petrotogales bacterium]
MNNKERYSKIEPIHLFIAIRRKKDQDESKKDQLQELCFRQIIRDRIVDYEILRKKIEPYEGVWRIYKTVNGRRLEPARKFLMKALIEEPERHEHKIDSLWKTALLQKGSRYEKKFLIDIDRKMPKGHVKSLMEELGIEIEQIRKTPNGWHVVTSELDSRDFQQYESIEIKRDGLIFIEKIDNAP